MSALNIYPSFQWTTGQTMTAQLLNNPLAAIQAWSTTIDNTNLTGGAGIFASQIVPLNTAEATFGGAVGYTIAPGSTTQVPLTLAGVVGQAVDLFDVLLTPGGIKPFSVASTGAVTALAGASGVTPLTVSGVGGQSVPMFLVTATSGGNQVFGITSGGIAFTTGLAALSAPAAAVGDLIVQRSASTGLISLGGATHVGQIDYGVTTALTYSFTNGPLYCIAGASSSIGANNGDIVAQRTVSTGLFGAGGATSSGTWDWNIFNTGQWSSRNNGTPGYADISGGTYHNASDMSLKTSIAPMADALALVQKLKPVSFTWKNSGLPGLGFLAQDVQAVFPELVAVDNEGTLTVNYDGIIPALVQAFQEYVATHP